MATLRPKKEFLREYEIDSSSFSTYCSRGKIIPQGDYIDIDLPQNAKWVENRLKFLKKKLQKATQHMRPQPQIKDIPDIQEGDLPEIIVKEIDQAAFDKLSLDDQKKTLEIRRLTQLTEIDRLKKEKLEGESLPFEEVTTLFHQTFKEFVSQFHSGAKNLTEIILSQHGATKNQKIEMNLQLEQIINNTLDQCKSGVNTILQNMVKNYSGSRSRGEKK